MIILTLPWYLIAIAAALAIIGSARLTRLLTHDAYPPTIWIRDTWARITRDGEWAKLASCYWCAAPWFFFVALGTFLLTFQAEWIAWAWWLFYAWMAGSYLTSQYVHFDEGRPE